MPEPGLTVLRCDLSEDSPDVGLEALDGSRRQRAKAVLELRPQQFDGIELRRVGRLVEDSDACGLEESRHLGDLVKAHVVQDHDVAALELGEEECRTNSKKTSASTAPTTIIVVTTRVNDLAVTTSSRSRCGGLASPFFE